MIWQPYYGPLCQGSLGQDWLDFLTTFINNLSWKKAEPHPVYSSQKYIHSQKFKRAAGIRKHDCKSIAYS
jgi:hypothetical protein